MKMNTGPAESLFSQAHMFSTCEQCGLCSSACPITGVDGFNVRRLLRYVELGLAEEFSDTPQPWNCTTCGRCEGVCPNGVSILEVIRPLRALSPEEFRPKSPPCIDACPAGVDVPGYLRHIAAGRNDEAYRLILESVPFPGILGRVCTHPCEDMCRRGEVNEPVSICALKRFAADNAGDLRDMPGAGEDTGKKVAVIGAGPAGLTAAFYLRKKGHKVVIFEARPKPGGMMRYGIPFYRLPEDILEREINQLLDMGIELNAGRSLGVDFGIRELKKGFDAVFIATGLWSSKKIPLKGSDLKGVHWGMDFLIAASEAESLGIKERVLVVGGGNVAVDVAMTCLRLGAKEVVMACLESREEMPANPREIEMALEEGVGLLPSWGPSEIMSAEGQITGVELIRCSSVFDEKGTFCPAFDDTKKRVETDQVILAIGQTSEFSLLEGGGIDVKGDLIGVNEETSETGIPGVFAGGDAASGPGTVVEAVASGKRAASAVDRYLGGDGEMESKEKNADEALSYTGKRVDGFADMRRERVPSLPVSERSGFAEVDLCYGDKQARAEAGRCLQCDLEIALAEALRSKE